MQSILIGKVTKKARSHQTKAELFASNCLFNYLPSVAFAAIPKHSLLTREDHLRKRPYSNCIIVANFVKC